MKIQIYCLKITKILGKIQNKKVMKKLSLSIEESNKLISPRICDIGMLALIRWTSYLFYKDSLTPFPSHFLYWPVILSARFFIARCNRILFSRPNIFIHLLLFTLQIFIKWLKAIQGMLSCLPVIALRTVFKWSNSGCLLRHMGASF